MSTHKGTRPLNSLLCLSLIASSILNAVAAENSSAIPPLVAKGASHDKTPPAAAKKSETGEEMTVLSPKVEKKAGTATHISAADMQRSGGNDFGTIMRYQPLVSAPHSAGGSSAGKSGFDRSGYSSYNIRGMEGNRVGIDVDGIPLPNATGRSYVGRTGLGTFGIGRDYLDPYMYEGIDIQSGTTAADNANSSIGGSVSFQPKSADNYLSPNKRHYFGYQSDYDSANRSWHNGLTVAGGDETLRGIFVLSQRNGQQTRNNSGSVSAFPANWHSTALLSSAIWQPNDEHQFTASADYYDKTLNSRLDTWNTAGSAVLGSAQQQSDTRRWSLSLKDRWTPSNFSAIDQLDTRVYMQNAQAHDDTYMPTTSAGDYQSVKSDYNTRTYGFETRAAKEWGIHHFSAGLNGKQINTQRPFSQDPPSSVYTVIMQPEANSRSYQLGGFVQDKMTWDVGGHDLSLVPALRAVYQHTKASNFDSLSSGALSADEAATLYGGSNSDTQILPSLSLLYDLSPTLTAYLQYKRGAQFPDASNLYGTWNLGSTYAGTQQYALIGNNDLKTETSNSFEMGLKGEATPGVTFSGSVFYTSYKNFIAYNRYTRSANPDIFGNIPGNIYIAYQAANRDRAYIYGGELTSKINYGTWYQQLNGLSTTVAVGYNQGKSKSSYSGDKYVDLDSVAPMKLVIGMAWDDPSQVYGTAITTTFQRGKRAEATNRETYSNNGSALTDATNTYMRIPGYGLVDLTAYYRVTPTVKISGGIYNLTDRKYWDYLSSRDIENTTNQDKQNQALAVEPGRSFQLGVNVDF